jgi:hypothetical protein
MRNDLLLGIVFLALVPSLAVAQSYRPQDPDFWGKTQRALADTNHQKVLRLAEVQEDNAKPESLVAAEAALARAQALKRLRLTYGSTRVLSDIIKSKMGTEVGLEALAMMEETVRQSPVDETEVYGDLINDYEFDILPAPLQNFVSYQQGLFNRIVGFVKWSEDEFKKIKTGSYWDFKLKYLLALDDVAADRIDAAIEKFLAVSEDAASPEDLRILSRHQYARLLFEKGDFQKAYKTFKTVRLNPREKGLILLERAWAKYYQKDYSKALGLISALDSPVFDPSRSPEPYVLKMIILKELCYYDAAFKVLGEFRQRFKSALTAIRQRKDLRKEQMIVNLSILDRRIEKWVNYYNVIKEERGTLQEYEWESYGFYGPMLQSYDSKLKEIKERLDWVLTDKARQVAEQLLDWEEQLTFLEYQTRLDSLRIRKKNEKTEYQPEDIPRLKFNKIYWENEGEYWIDELEDFKVLVRSQCAERYESNEVPAETEEGLTE